MEIAPDFFSYFEAAATLLDSDKYTTSVSKCYDHIADCLFSNIFFIFHENVTDPLWPFLHGMTMDKSSLCMTLVSYF